ncbi:hypothetical protein [Pyrobaculum sp.]|uniref:Uncharacterized protein n=1 Tax=Pyrobaculum oguniense (strain DSM 13380 / JCM 10595 / TE7) TaxID=698757 RepID=H6Q6E5_PYROT|nr:hypothetical protein Pogu_0076 [Pyrobaculum oguniense TE7]
MEKEIRKYKTYMTVVKVGTLAIASLVLFAAATILPTNTATIGYGIF